MDKSDELPDVNTLSLRDSGAQDDTACDIDSLLRDISNVFSSIFGEPQPKISDHLTD
jgi:hypothetical protein